MIDRIYATRRLVASDAAQPWRCSDPVTTAQLRRCHSQQEAGILAAYVLPREPEDPPTLPELLGYYTLSFGQLKSEGEGSSAYPGPVPVLRIAYLGVHADAEGAGIGSLLLHDALTRCAELSGQAGGIGVVLTAPGPTAFLWAGRRTFVAIDGDDAPYPRQLFAPMGTVRRIVASAG